MEKPKNYGFPERVKVYDSGNKEITAHDRFTLVVTLTKEETRKTGIRNKMVFCSPSIDGETVYVAGQESTDCPISLLNLGKRMRREEIPAFFADWVVRTSENMKLDM